jgi:hypothetical protein
MIGKGIVGTIGFLGSHEIIAAVHRIVQAFVLNMSINTTHTAEQSIYRTHA